MKISTFFFFFFWEKDEDFNPDSHNKTNENILVNYITHNNHG